MRHCVGAFPSTVWRTAIASPTITLIRPPLHHADALVPVLAPRICPSDGIPVLMGKGPFYRVGGPQSALVQDRAGGGAEATSGRFGFTVA